MWYNLIHYNTRYAGINKNWDKTRAGKELRWEMKWEILDERWDERWGERWGERWDERWVERWDKLGHMIKKMMYLYK